MNNLQGAMDFLKQQQANRSSVYKYKQPNGNMEGPSGGFGQVCGIITRVDRKVISHAF
jgi:hypothetical protein